MELSAKNQTLDAKLAQSEIENSQYKDKIELQSHQIVEKSSKKIYFN